MGKSKRTIAVLGIGTAVPPHSLEQTETSNRLVDILAERKDVARWVRRIFRSCGVETRYTCEPNLLEHGQHCHYFSSATSDHDTPTTADRMARYKQESVPLASRAAREAFADSEVNKDAITHLITVSCTGFFLPGVDVALMRQLGLPSHVNRIPLTFLGCAAGLSAIRIAREIVAGNPSAKVLIVSVELCTLHVQASYEREDLFAAAFFGDGAAACIIGEAHASAQRSSIFVLGNNHTVIFSGTEDEMVWNVGNYGFSLFLSPKIPQLISQFVPTEIARLLDGDRKPELWAIHPGGRGIIDSVQTRYDLTDAQTQASRTILRRFGNMSSATILFVLQQLRDELSESVKQPKDGVALAFGPGLNAELTRFTYTPATPLDGDVQNG